MRLLWSLLVTVCLRASRRVAECAMPRATRASLGTSTRSFRSIVSQTLPLQRCWRCWWLLLMADCVVARAAPSVTSMTPANVPTSGATITVKGVRDPLCVRLFFCCALT